MVSHTDRNDRVRIISARELTQAERKAYAEKKRLKQMTNYALNMI